VTSPAGEGAGQNVTVRAGGVRGPSAVPCGNPVGRRGCYTRVVSTQELLAQVLRLPRPERARLAEEVLTSLEESEEQVAAAWVRELEGRSREVAVGGVTPVDWETARVDILNELERRRAGRSTS